jgi:MFS family permease
VPPRTALGRPFHLLWAAFAVSTFGTYLAFDAFPLVAILVLHAGPAAVSGLAATGLAAGALLAVPLGPWVAPRRKRPVLVAMDLLRFGALLSVPLAFAAHRLTLAHLLLVSVLVTAATITFRAAGGSFLKTLVPPDQLLAANARFESTTWLSILVGPPLGGAAIGVFGPVITIVGDGVSYLLSAVGIGAIRAAEPPPRRRTRGTPRTVELLEGWRSIVAHRGLRPLFFNTVLVNGLVLAVAPLLAVLMLGRLGFPPWQYGLAFAAPSVGGLLGARAARPLAARLGRRRAMVWSGALRACWPVGLAFLRSGPAGLALVIGLELGLIACVGVFNPIFATYRLEQVSGDRLPRVLSAWSISSKIATAILTALWGALAAAAGPRAAVAAAGVLLLGTPLLLPWRERTARTAAPASGPTFDALANGDGR